MAKTPAFAAQTGGGAAHTALAGGAPKMTTIQAVSTAETGLKRGKTSSMVIFLIIILKNETYRSNNIDLCYFLSNMLSLVDAYASITGEILVWLTVARKAVRPFKKWS